MPGRSVEPIVTRAEDVLRFGPYQVDRQTGEFSDNGRKLKLQDQPFQILVALLERPGEVVTREDLRQKLWPGDTFVDFDNSVNIAVRKLRQALNDNATQPRFIETLPKRGYRFIAPVEPSTAERDTAVRWHPLRRGSAPWWLTAVGALVAAGLAIAGAYAGAGATGRSSRTRLCGCARRWPFWASVIWRRRATVPGFRRPWRRCWLPN